MAKKNDKMLSQEYELGFSQPQTTGPAVSQFLSGLRDKKLLGVKSSNNEVIIPPMEFDPKTGELLNEFVEVSPEGEVLSWCWVRHPREKHPIREPFAWALIKLDGADTPLVHCVFTDDECKMETGMRVQVRWADNTRGNIKDIVCFEPILSNTHILGTK